MKKKNRFFALWIVCAAVFLSSSLSTFAASNTAPDRSNLSREVRYRSRDYVRSLSRRPLSELSTEDKLLLLHAHYNLKHDAAVARIGELVLGELKALPPERQEPFIEMVETAYRALGHKKKASHFRKKVMQTSSRQEHLLTT